MSDDEEESLFQPREEEEAVQVELKWVEDRVVSEINAVYVILSENKQVELKKTEGSFKAEILLSPGSYSGQMVIGDRIFHFMEFVVEPESKEVFLIVDRNDSIDDSRTRNGGDEDESPIQSPRGAKGGRQVFASLVGNESSDNSDVGDLLIEEDFDMNTRTKEKTKKEELPGHISPEFHQEYDKDIFSPDDPTIQNITETFEEDFSPRRDKVASENEFSEDDKRMYNRPSGFTQLSGHDSSPEDDSPLQNRRHGSKSDQIFRDVSIHTNETSEYRSRQEEFSSLPSNLNQHTDVNIIEHQQHLKSNSPRIIQQQLLTGSPISNERPRRRASDGSGNSPRQRQTPRQKQSPRNQELDSVSKEAEQKEFKRLKDLVENYKEVKAELEVKCKSYDEEVQRLNKKCQDLEKKYHESNKAMLELKQENEVKNQSYESEVDRLKQKCNEVIDALDSKIEEVDEKKLVDVKKKYEEKIVQQAAEIQSLREGLKNHTQVDSDNLQNKSGATKNQQEEIQLLRKQLASYEQEMHNVRERCKELEEDKQKTNIMTQKDERVRNFQRVNELEKKCKSYEVEMKRLQDQCAELENAARQKALEESPAANNRQDEQMNKVYELSELHARCESYESEVKRLQNACRELKFYIKKEKEQRTEKEEENKILVMRINACNEELEKQERRLRSRASSHGVEKLIAAHNEENLQNHQTISELEAKCQSYQTEMERMKKHNEKLIEKYTKMKEHFKALTVIQTRMDVIENENKKLKEENESLEMVSKLREKDVEDEKKAFEKDLSDLRKENQNLKSKVSKLSTSNHLKARENIAMLEQGNDQLRRKFRSYDNDNDRDIDHNDIDNYKPKIKGQRKKDFILGKHIDYPNLQQKSQLPDKPIKHDRKYEDGDSDILSNNSRNDRRPTYDYRSYSAHEDNYDMKQTAERRPNERFEKNNGTTTTTSYYSRTNLDDIMKRYSSTNSSTNLDQFTATAKHYSSSPHSIEDTMKRYSGDYSTLVTTRSPSNHKRRGSLTDTMDSQGYHFASGSTESRLPPKARSYDTGFDKLGGDEVSSPQRTSRTSSRSNFDNALMPFSPSNLRDLNVGMRVSVTRADGRTSRCVVKWKGELPGYTGSYIGAELETESGRHDGVYEGVRYFKCKPNKGIFVKFSKVIMGWR